VIKYVISEEDAKRWIAKLQEERLRVEAELAALEEAPVPIALPGTAASSRATGYSRCASFRRSCAPALSPYLNRSSVVAPNSAPRAPA
jgi:hypothetical protein